MTDRPRTRLRTDKVFRCTLCSNKVHRNADGTYAHDDPDRDAHSPMVYANDEDRDYSSEPEERYR